jgi:hypothetical protein
MIPYYFVQWSYNYWFEENQIVFEQMLTQTKLSYMSTV